MPLRNRCAARTQAYPDTKGTRDLTGLYAPSAAQGWAYTAYFYTDPAHAHAVTSLSSGDTFAYDANGNMTQRVEGGVTYTQNFDIENRLASVTVNGQTYQYVFDGDGRKVKEIAPDGSYTIYIGDWYDVEFNSGGTQTGATSHYYAGSQRVAFRQDGVLSYLLTDHLGSSSVTLDTAGAIVAEERYYPFGELRDGSWSLSTNFGYTGQRRLEGTGLLDYDARAYLPSVGRFISPDTIVPGLYDPQNLNRFSYVLNTPLVYDDPSGHCVICDIFGGLETLVANTATNLWNQFNLGGQAVSENSSLIVQYANDEHIYPISVAIGIKAQGNSWQRYFPPPFDEPFQMSLSPSTGIPVIDSRIGPNASVGIAQMAAYEVDIYIPSYGCTHSCALDPNYAVLMMARKIARADALLGENVDPTDRLMVHAMAQNFGATVAQVYVDHGGRWNEILLDTGADVANLRKGLAIAEYLSDSGQFRLPNGVDLKKWKSIVNTDGKSRVSAPTVHTPSRRSMINQ